MGKLGLMWKARQAESAGHDGDTGAASARGYVRGDSSHDIRVGAEAIQEGLEGLAVEDPFAFDR
jgi:hypothetical protein